MQKDRFFWAALALTLANLVYWTAYNINAFFAFKFTNETAMATVSFYYLTHLAYLLKGLQFLTVGQHISPLTVFLIGPFYYFFPSPLTLSLIKAIVLSLSGIVVYYVAKGFSNAPKFSLALTVAYFFNPGTICMQLFEYHPELFIIPLYLLTFYFCMKCNKKGFYVSLCLLLCTFESILSIAFMLGFGILAYEYLYDKDKLKSERIRLAWMIIVCTILAMGFYNYVYYSVQGTYSSNYPVQEELVPFPLVPPLGGASYNYPQGWVAADAPAYATYATEITLVAFGLLAVAVLPSLVLFIAPWLAGVFILHNTAFFYAWRYSYAIPGAVIAAMLGYVVLMRRFPVAAPKLPIPEIIAIISLLLCAYLLGQPFSMPFYSRLLSPPQEMLTFQTNQSEAASYAQLDYIISLIPKNASLMTSFNLWPMLSNRQYSEPIAMLNQHYFKPEYILYDPDVSVQLAYVNEAEYLANYTAGGNYSIVAENGSAELWKLR